LNYENYFDKNQKHRHCNRSIGGFSYTQSPIAGIIAFVATHDSDCKTIRNCLNDGSLEVEKNNIIESLFGKCGKTSVFVCRNIQKNPAIAIKNKTIVGEL
jgi:hypothetical protein